MKADSLEFYQAGALGVFLALYYLQEKCYCFQNSPGGAAHLDFRYNYLNNFGIMPAVPADLVRWGILKGENAIPPLSASKSAAFAQHLTQEAIPAVLSGNGWYHAVLV